MESADILDAPTPYLIGVVTNNKFPKSVEETQLRADLPESYVADLVDSGCFVILLDEHRVVAPKPPAQDRSDRLPLDLRNELAFALQHLHNKMLSLMATDPFGLGASAQKLSDAMLSSSAVTICKLLSRIFESPDVLTILRSTQALSHFKQRTEPEQAEIRRTLLTISSISLQAHSPATGFKAIFDPFPAKSAVAAAINAVTSQPPTTTTISPSGSSTPPPAGTLRRHRQNRAAGGGEWSLSGLLTGARLGAHCRSATQCFAQLVATLTDTADECARALTEALISYCVDVQAKTAAAQLIAFLQILVGRTDQLNEALEAPLTFSYLYSSLGGLNSHETTRECLIQENPEPTAAALEDLGSNITAVLCKSKHWFKIVSIIEKWLSLCQARLKEAEEELDDDESAEEPAVAVVVSAAASMTASVPSHFGPPSSAMVHKAIAELGSDGSVTPVTAEQWERWLLDCQFGLEYDEAVAIVMAMRNAQLRRSGVSIGSIMRRSPSVSDKNAAGSVLTEAVVKNMLNSLLQQREQIEKVESSIPVGVSLRSTIEDSLRDSTDSKPIPNEVWVASTVTPNSVFRLVKKQKNCFLLLSTTRLLILQQQSSVGTAPTVAFQLALKSIASVEKFSSDKTRRGAIGSGGYERKALSLTQVDSADATETLLFPTQSVRDVWYQILTELLWSFRLSRDLADPVRFLLRSARRVSFVAALHSIGSWVAGAGMSPIRVRSSTSSLLPWCDSPPLRTAGLKATLSGFLNVSGLDSTIPAFKAADSPNKIVLDLLASALSLFLSIHSLGSRDLDLDASAARVAEFEAFEKSTSKLQQLDLAPLQASRNERVAFWTNLWNLMYLHGALRSRWLPGNALEHRYLTSFTSYVVGRLPLSLDTVLQLLRGSAPVLGTELSPKRLNEADYRAQWGLNLLDMDPRVHFVMAWFCKSSPRINLVSASAEALENTLEQATRNYLEKTVKVNYETRTITLPRLLYWFREDWRQTADMLSWVADKLPADSPTKSSLNETLTMSIVYSWDWDPSDD